MKIKEVKIGKTALNQFDLLGHDEVGLSKAFAYVMGSEPLALYTFLHYIGIKVQYTDKNFYATSIETERFRLEGRTDIEIKHSGKYHIIIESKVRSNKVKLQRKQYISSFDNEPRKVLCFITGINDFKKDVYNNIEIHNLGWLEIFNLFDQKKYSNNKLIREFLDFMRKGFKMREQKEILVQDLGNDNEIKRFLNYQVYRRDVVFGSPLYFAPYFTKRAGQKEGEGISYLSKILGILSLKPKDIENFRDDLMDFNNKSIELTDKWIQGVKTIYANTQKEFTYFFLDEPLKLYHPLKKDKQGGKGRGKDWIAAMIPKNRCVTFIEFARRIANQRDSI